jgi:N-acetylneuraminic acid mutarotase
MRSLSPTRDQRVAQPISLSGVETTLDSVNYDPSKFTPPPTTSSVVTDLRAEVKRLKGGVIFVGILAVLVIVIVLVTTADSASTSTNAASSSLPVIFSTSPVLSSNLNLKGSYKKGTPLFEGEGEWIDKVSLDDKMSDGQAVACNGKIYVLGGLTLNNAAGVVRNHILEYDPYYETIVRKADMPVGRFRFGAACHDNKVFVLGGFSSKADGDDGNGLATMHAFDTLTNSWSTKASMTVPRGDLTFVTVGTKLYACGGYGIGYDMTVAGTANEEYDPATDSWTTKASMKHARGDLVGAALDGKLYAVAGFNEVYPPQPTNFVEIFDPVTNTWTTGPPIKLPRGDPAFGVKDGHLFVIGGETYSSKVPCDADGNSLSGCWVCGACIPVHDVEMFDPATQTWTTMAPYPGNRFRFSAATANDVIWTFGGHTQGELATNTVSAFYYVNHKSLFVHLLDSSA